MRSLYLIRGLPGSGKSTLAKARVESGLADLYLEADMWINYQKPYAERNMPNAHQECQYATWKALKQGKRVVVSNTFTRLWELQPYLDLATEFKIQPVIVTATGRYPNIHGVPDEAIEAMQARWEELEC